MINPSLQNNARDDPESVGVDQKDPAEPDLNGHHGNETMRSPSLRLESVQALPTTGARAVCSFVLDGSRHLAIPQLAADLPGTPPNMNGGDSDIGMPIFRWSDGRFEPWRTLPVHGGEDAEFFMIGERAFLATASIRSGKGPYEYNTNSALWEWMDGAFRPVQHFATFAAKQWRHVRIGARDFLALAQGVVMPGLNARDDGRSTIFEWTGERFEPFQRLESTWGYNWHHFRIGGTDYVAYADHDSPSLLMRWSGATFERVQAFDGAGGRAFAFFEAEGAAWLAFARLTDDSLLYRWDGERFIVAQTLEGLGARELTSFAHGGARYLGRVNFITGTRQAPRTDLQSVLYVFADGRLTPVADFPTSGGTAIASFEAEGARYLAVSESLSRDARFGTPSRIYRVA